MKKKSSSKISLKKSTLTNLRAETQQAIKGGASRYCTSANSFCSALRVCGSEDCGGGSYTCPCY
jgi:hypothetical protein